MTKVTCFLEECIHNKNQICGRDSIILDKEHDCEGGCDYGWSIPEEEEDE